MIKIFQVLFFAFLMASQGVFSDEVALTIPQASKPFIMCSIPKSGSHLISKLLRKITIDKMTSLVGVAEFDKDKLSFPPHQKATVENLFRIFPDKTPQTSLAGHFNYHILFTEYAKRHRDCVRIMMIRDLRDICVSTTFFIDDSLKDALGPNATFDQKLMYVIQGEGFIKDSNWNVMRSAHIATKWMKDPSVVVCRFEDLCGEKGGSTKEAQEKQILAVANAIGVTLSANDIEFLTNYLWGGSATFRKGKKGGWKEHFKPEHNKAFRQRMGKLSVQLGYPL